MSGKVWMSSVKSNSSLFNKPGVRAKFYGNEWEPAKHNQAAPGHERMAIIRRHGSGFRLDRSELPEAAAVFDEKCFKKTTDIFAVGGFYVVKGKLAEVLSRFDLGEGQLVPFTIYQADLVTALEGPFFLLNFGARKNSFLPDASKPLEKLGVDKKTGKGVWSIKSWVEDDDITLTIESVLGADIWMEEAVHGKIFVSDALASAITDIGLAEDFRLTQCRIVEAQS